MTIPGLAVLIVVLACGEVLYRKVTGRAALPWMRDDTRHGVGAIGLEQFDAAFNPARRHEFEERETMSMYRENPGDGTPGESELDLDSGRVRLPRNPG
ncbi:hypothetical protein EBN03_04500 [Nocardia stercoris]|uniref:Uncharacterized protein n=2 Tax=Nocardia stercoris TaxID=2483361 RepID=A0A3M2LG02_9NOCA|nr:hypothetical protein EBN03_04500 [Nocardia stercoris]